jgi:ribonuclease P protein component
MLKKSQKLTTKDHKKLVISGKRKHGKIFSLQFVKYDRETSKCAVVVPKKISNSAVVRNENKRKTFDIMQELYPQLKPGYLFTLVVKHNLKELSISDIKAELLQLFENFLN